MQALRALRRRCRLAIISNIDDGLSATTARQLEVPFDAVVTAVQARCYKPDRAIFEEALRRLGAWWHGRAGGYWAGSWRWERQ